MHLADLGQQAFSTDECGLPAIYPTWTNLLATISGAMACYLSFSSIESECEGCTRVVGPGLVGWTTEILPGRLRPLCPACLEGLDRRLATVQRVAARWPEGGPKSDGLENG